MTTPNDNLERLISRFLDDEATPVERAQLKSLMRRDPQAASQFDDVATLDREVRYALRRRFGKPLTLHRPLPLWRGLLRGAGIAAAACVAALLWTQMPARDATDAHGPAKAGMENLFTLPLAAQDSLVEHVDGFERPQVQTGDSQRRWILIPTEDPREFLLIELNQGQRRTIRIQADF
jgi:hypothetical protein